MHALQPTRSERLKAAIGTIVLQAALGYALIVGLAPSLPVAMRSDLKIFSIAPEKPPPPERPIPPKEQSGKPEGAASPPNLRAKASEVVASTVIPPIILPPPPVIAAPKPGRGADRSAGSADIVGPGTGSGGIGTGTGSGGAGDGEGGGGGTPARWLRGRIKDSDYPREASEQGIEGSLTTRYLIGTDGHVIDCEIVKSSGSRVLDEATCRLVMRRYRYEPARDAAGRRITDRDEEDHSWVLVR